MPAVRQVHSQKRVARLEERKHRGVVRLRTRVRLHVRVFRAEQLLGAIDRDLLDLIDDLAAAVVPLPRQSLGVLVRERRRHRLEHRRRHEILAGDELESVALPCDLLIDELRDLGVRIAERRAR
jgi:hypothetical protein